MGWKRMAERERVAGVGVRERGKLRGEGVKEKKGWSGERVGVEGKPGGCCFYWNDYGRMGTATQLLSPKRNVSRHFIF